MNAILYVRVSSLEQEKEGYSLDAQEKLGIDYAKKKDLNITRIWKVVESAWNSKKERLAFNQMIEFAKKHPDVEHIIFDITDRMTRNDFDKLKILNLIKDYDKTIHFSRSNKFLNKYATSEDIFMMDIEVAVAKKMSNDISRKTQMGMLEKAEQGIYPSTAPLGYKNNKETKMLDVDLERAPFIRQAFEMIASGNYSLGMAIDKLYEDGLRGKHGNKLGKGSLETIIKNPIYYGVFRWKGKLYVNAKHEALIGKDLFDQAQSVLSGKKRPYKTRAGFSFNNLMKCGKCGCRVSGEMKKNKYTYYHCMFSKGKHDGWGYFREERIVEIFEEPVKKVTIPHDLYLWMIDMLNETSKNVVETTENRRIMLQKEFEMIQTRLSRLIDEKLDGTLENEIYEMKSNEYKDKLFNVKSQIQRLDQLSPNFDQGFKTLELSKNLYSEYVRQDSDGKAEILKTIASNYTLDDVSITATYRKPFSILAKGLSRSKWLPAPKAKRTHNIIHLHIQIYLMRNGNKGLEIVEGKAPYQISTNNRITKKLLQMHKPIKCKPNPIKLALRYQEIYKSLSSPSMAKVGEKFGVTRVRAHQITSLLKLDQRIIDYLQDCSDPKIINYWTERKLRGLLRLKKKEQMKNFKQLFPY